MVVAAPFRGGIPDDEVRQSGMFRDGATAKSVHDDSRLSEDRSPAVGLVPDRMPATGSSAVEAVCSLEEWGMVDMRMLTVIVAAEGSARLQRECPDGEISWSVCNSELNAAHCSCPGFAETDELIG